VLFAPSEAELYPQPQGYKCCRLPNWPISSKALSAWLLHGVCTVVHKLFNLVQPRIAVFGRRLSAAHDPAQHGHPDGLAH